MSELDPFIARDNFQREKRTLIYLRRIRDDSKISKPIPLACWRKELTTTPLQEKFH